MADKDQGLRITHVLGPTSPYVEYGDDQRLLGSLPSAFSPASPFDDPRKGEARSSSVYLSQSSSRNGRIYRRLGRFSVALLYITGLYSTLLSGAWLAIAIKQPHWGNFINYTDSNLTPSLAATIAAALAKSIELSFLTFFLAMMGQYLTRRASNNEAPGISLADVQLKVLMMLPGTLFTQWRSYGRALLSVLGLASLVACFSGLLYTTASQALVNPRPSTISNVNTLYGQLNTTPANYDYIKKDCPAEDKDTCIQTEYAGRAFNNFFQYMTSWQQLSASKVSADPAERPPPIAVFKDNVTVQGSWVDTSVDFEAASQDYNRNITGVTMVMPHTGVIAAASLRDNGLPQVQNTEGNMNAMLDAQTVVPTVDVLCAQGSAQELSPLIYTDWSSPQSDLKTTNLPLPSGWYNSSVFDPIFGFNASSPPPVFYRLPGAYNSILSGNYDGASTLYVLIASAPEPQIEYNLCGMSMGLRGGCSSEFSMSISGSMLRSNCITHDMSYNKSLKLAQEDTPANWVALAFSWAETVALDTGDKDTNAAFPHMLVELTVQSQSTSSSRPLMVEGLAVLAANTILDSMVAAPFNGSWPYQSKTLEQPKMQQTIARVTMSDFASGVGAPWQRGFMFVLASVFILNLVFLGYLIFISAIRPCLSRLRNTDPSRNGLWRDCTDFSELFQIALNSPQPGLGSPVGVAQEKGKLHDMKWHFRNRAAVGTPGGSGLDGLHLSFDGEENYRMDTPREGCFYSPVAERTSPRKR